MYNFWLPQNLITNSLLLTESLTNNINSQLTHILYVPCIIYYILRVKVSQRKKKVIKKIFRKYIYSTQCIYWGKNLHISGPTVQTHIVQGSTIYVNIIIPLLLLQLVWSRFLLLASKRILTPNFQCRHSMRSPPTIPPCHIISGAFIHSYTQWGLTRKQPGPPCFPSKSCQIGNQHIVSMWVFPGLLFGNQTITYCFPIRYLHEINRFKSEIFQVQLLW